MNTYLYLDSRWNLCFTLTITASVSWEIRQNLTIFFVSFPVKGTCDLVFLLKLQTAFYQLQNQPRTSLAGFFFGKKRWPITFRWLLLFIAFTGVTFKEKACFIEVTSFNYSFTETWSVHFARSWWRPIIKGRCNTLCSNDISLNVTLISTACHWIVSR